MSHDIFKYFQILTHASSEYSTKLVSKHDVNSLNQYICISQHTLKKNFQYFQILEHLYTYIIT